MVVIDQSVLKCLAYRLITIILHKNYWPYMLLLIINESYLILFPKVMKNYFAKSIKIILLSCNYKHNP